LDVGHELHHLYCFRADPRAVEGLKYAGFGVVSVADNHIYDWRRLEWSRGPLPLVVNLDGVKLAFLAFVSVEL
jgi:hypothetical protein